MNLYILRHASAGTRRPNPALDLKRPLDKEGKEQCLRLAHLLNALKISFDLVVSSPLKRALQTAQFVATETGYENRIHISTGLAPEATLADFKQMLQEAGDCENVLAVGHNPNLQTFLGALLLPAQKGGTAAVVPLIRLRKASLARVTIGAGTAGLLGLIDPRIVRAVYRTSVKAHKADHKTSTTKSRPKTSRK
jgi:phosphohistidine phosphatase